ncbi:MAG: hypothetical protein ACI93E_001338 [Flavobacteriales bacterium]|jgi:hypothetical protein
MVESDVLQLERVVLNGDFDILQRNGERCAFGVRPTTKVNSVVLK